MSGVATPLDKHVLYGVRVIVEKQPLDNIWQPFRWVISDLMPLQPQAGSGAPPINNTPVSYTHLTLPTSNGV